MNWFFGGASTGERTASSNGLTLALRWVWVSGYKHVRRQDRHARAHGLNHNQTQTQAQTLTARRLQPAPASTPIPTRTHIYTNPHTHTHPQIRTHTTTRAPSRAVYCAGDDVHGVLEVSSSEVMHTRENTQ